jgi:hypothetical protein
LSWGASQGFTIFVVSLEDAMLSGYYPPYRNLHQQIIDRCDLVADLRTDRPLFFEANVKIYRLRDQGAKPPVPAGSSSPPGQKATAERAGDRPRLARGGPQP